MGEARTDPLRLDFDLKLKLEFHGTEATSDADLLAYRELDETLDLTSAIERRATVREMTSLLLRVGFFLACALSCAPTVDDAQEAYPQTRHIEKMKSSRLRILVPAYFAPRGNGLADWDKLLGASDRIPIVAILAPAVGPGKRPDPDYVKLLKRAEKTGIVLIGYIHSSYTKRSIQDLKADVDTWIRFYPGIQGIFVDEQSARREHVTYYGELRRYVREVRGLKLMVSNPGLVCSREFFSRHASDVICIYENHEAFGKIPLPDWAATHPSVDVLLLPHNVGLPEQMAEWIALAVEKKFRYIYVTDDTGNNPWDRLPVYWDKEVDAVQRVNNAVAK